MVNEPMTTLDVCICTHNPRRDVFQLALAALGRQTLSKDAYRVWVIDNASTPPLTEQDLQPLSDAGVSYVLQLEPQLGTVYARLRAAKETQGELVVFVDDDNELPINYLETAVAIATHHPEIGCFGGKLLAATELPQWIQPLQQFLAIVDKGEEVISNCADHWGLWEPPTAGAVVRRAVLDRFIYQMETVPASGKIGCKGTKEILRGEDSLMMRGAYRLGLQCSYQPQLTLTHHIDLSRVKFSYMVKLLFGYGRSFVILERALGRPLRPVPFVTMVQRTFRNARERDTKSLVHTICMLAWDIGYFYEMERGYTGVRKKPAKPTVVRPEVERIALPERLSFMKQLKSRFPEAWEFFRQLALKLRLIS